MALDVAELGHRVKPSFQLLSLHRQVADDFDVLFVDDNCLDLSEFDKKLEKLTTSCAAASAFVAGAALPADRLDLAAIEAGLLKVDKIVERVEALRQTALKDLARAETFCQQQVDLKIFEKEMLNKLPSYSVINVKVKATYAELSTQLKSVAQVRRNLEDNVRNMFVAMAERIDSKKDKMKQDALSNGMDGLMKVLDSVVQDMEENSRMCLQYGPSCFGSFEKTIGSFQKISRNYYHMGGELVARIKFKFKFIRADALRKYQRNNGPVCHHQKIHEVLGDGCIIEEEISFSQCLRGIIYEKIVVVSHRWEEPGCPDPECAQVGAIQKFLMDKPHIEYVWYDYWCMPQNTGDGRRSNEEEQYFRDALANIYLLFLGANVLILLDLQYNGRFWTLYETWLALHDCKAEFPGSKRRCTIAPLHAATEAHREALIKTWIKQGPKEAENQLRQRDILVTNKHDKDEQLNVLRMLAMRVPWLDNLVRAEGEACFDDIQFQLYREQTLCEKITANRISMLCVGISMIILFARSQSPHEDDAAFLPALLWLFLCWVNRIIWCCRCMNISKPHPTLFLKDSALIILHWVIFIIVTGVFAHCHRCFGEIVTFTGCYVMMGYALYVIVVVIFYYCCCKATVRKSGCGKSYFQLDEDRFVNQVPAIWLMFVAISIIVAGFGDGGCVVLSVLVVVCSSCALPITNSRITGLRSLGDGDYELIEPE